MINTQIAHYKITAKLGEGGMGAVYRATDTKLNRDVAIKVLPAAFAADPDRMARFTREAQVLAQLNHPNIAAIYGVEERALIMELVEGADLATPVPLETALDYTRQLIDGLEYAHEKGVVHRDLKPANIKITPQGQVKILDFGLAKINDPARTESDIHNSPTLTIGATSAGTIMGTAAYMSPEQARGQSVDKRADIWAFGVIVWEMLAGRQLFGGGTVSDVLAHVLTRPIELEAVPQAVRTLVERCLQREARQRLRDIGDARHLLVEQPKAEPPAQAKLVRWPLGLAAVATVAAVIFGVLWLRGGSHSPPLIRYALSAEGGGRYTLSPNGDKIMAYSPDGIKVRPVDSMEWKKLGGTEGTQRAFWSTDSTGICFQIPRQLKVVNLKGGSARVLTEVDDDRYSGCGWKGGAGGGQVAFVSGGKLFTADSASGAKKEAGLMLPQGDYPTEPVFLPEGNSVAFLVVSKGQMIWSRFDLSAPGGPLEKLLPMNKAARYARHPQSGKWLMFFMSEANSLQVTEVDPRSGRIEGKPQQVVSSVTGLAREATREFSVADNGRIIWTYRPQASASWRLHWVDLHGNIIGSIGERASIQGVRLSPDETKVVATHGGVGSQLWLYDLKTGISRRLTSSAESESAPVWFNDSKSIIFLGRNSGSRKLYRIGLMPGAAPEEVFNDSSNVAFPAQMAPDNHNLLVQTAFTGLGSGLFSLDLAKPINERKLEPVSEKSISAPAMSPDGKFVVIRTTDGADAVVQLPAQAGREKPAGRLGRHLEFSPDGKTLFLLDGDNVYSCAVTRGANGEVNFGDRALLFRHISGANVTHRAMQIARDGKRILTFLTDQPELIAPQFASDWTQLHEESSTMSQ